MKHSLGTAALACLVLVAGSPGPAFAQAQPILYEMGKDSSYEQGCYAPCACPIMMIEPIRGTMVVTPLPADGNPYDRYEVSQVRWVVRSSFLDRRLTGRGILYSGGQFALLHRLELDLSTDDGPVEHFDSGWLSGSVGLSALDFPISLHGFYCFDTGILVRARPSLRVDVAPAALRWDAAAGASGYDVVRGDLGALSPGGDFSQSIAACLGDDVTVTGLADSEAPAPGAGFWYLVRGVGGLVGDFYDSGEAAQIGSRDAGLSAAPGSCP